MNSRNAYFALQIKNDGTYLNLYPAEQGGRALTLDAITQYLTMIHFEDYNMTQLMNDLKNCNYSGCIKLSKSTIRPVDETIKVSIDQAEFGAECIFYAPSNGGSTLAKEEIIEALNQNKVKYGIDHNLIEQWVNHREYNKPFLIAKGKDPVQGSNGYVKYCFHTDLSAHPKINDDGTVDYRQLDNIEHIEQGAKLAELIEGVQGKPGMLVTGKAIAAAKVKNPKLKHGKNIELSEDGHTMYSLVSGHVYLVDDKVFVSNIYEIPGNVDASTGNIDFNGDVHVKGNVTSGFQIKATGQILVDGVVEGSWLQSEGPIIIRGGIQGMTKAHIVSESNVTAKFIENASVDAGGDVSTEAILHSKVNASRNVNVKGKKGLVIGGEIHAGEAVTLKVAGSPMNVFTQMEVGIDPALVNEYRSLDQEIRKEQQEQSQLTQILTVYRQKLKKGLNLNASQVTTVKQIGARLLELEKEMPDKLYRRDELGEVIIKSNKGSVVIEDKVYPRVKVVISSAVTITREEIHYCKFIKDGEDVKSVSL